jgi:RNA polymerase sigma-70 factor (ECF subfamily)
MPPPFDVELQIQRHGGALRELARVLLRDDADAEDAVQETWRRVIGSPPRHQERIGGWLAAILRNVAFRLRRSESRRVRHEERAAARGQVAEEDQAERLARAEIAHRLIAAVDALDAPYRDAIWQRFFDGRAPRDIAAASGLPLATVKSRLQRGLATLRERLGEREGSDWRAGCVAAFGLGKPGTTAATIAGGVLMATWTKVTAGAIAAAVALAAWLSWPDASVSAPPAAMQRETAVASGATGAERAAPPLDGVASNAGLEPERTAASTATVATATVRGRCVDEHGTGIAACAVQLSGWMARSPSSGEWVLEHGDAPIEIATTSANDGRFEISFVPPTSYNFSMTVQSEGRARYRVDLNDLGAGVERNLGDIVMRAGALVRGRIVDVVGQPVEAWIDAVPAERAVPVDRATTTAGVMSRPDGTFAFTTSLPSGRYSFQVSGGCTVQSPAPLELLANAPVTETRVVVAFPDVPTITGIVADGAGQPVCGASVTWSRGGQPVGGGYSKRDGTFTLRCTAGDPKLPVRLTAGQYGYEPAQHGGDVPWGTRDVRIRMARGVDLTVLVRDASGQPLAGCTVRVLPPDTQQWQAGVVKARTGADGVAAFDRLVRGEYVVVAQFATARGLPPRIERVTLAGAPVQLDLRIGTQPSRTLRVQRVDGTPVGGTRVQLCELLGTSFGAGRQVLAPGSWFDLGSSALPILALEDAFTGADGKLLLSGPGGRELGLRVLGPGHVAVERSDVRLDVPGDLVVTVAAGARVHGRIEPAAAVDELRRLASSRPAAAFLASRHPAIRLRTGGTFVPRGTAPPEERERFLVADDGTFDVAELPAGTAQVELTYVVKGRSMETTRSVVLGTRLLRDGESIEIVADLTELLPGTIQGSVLLNGEPWPRAVLVVESTHGVGPDGKDVKDELIVETDAMGRLELSGRPGRYRMRRAEDSVFASTVIELRRGDVVPATFEFATGELSIRLLQPDGSPAQGVGLCVSGDVLAHTGVNGLARIGSRPRTVSLRVLPKRLQTERAQNELRLIAGRGGDPFAAHWIELGEVAIVAGKTTELELRLPAEWEK